MLNWTKKTNEMVIFFRLPARQINNKKKTFFLLCISKVIRCYGMEGMLLYSGRENGFRQIDSKFCTLSRFRKEVEFDSIVHEISPGIIKERKKK